MENFHEAKRKVLQGELIKAALNLFDHMHGSAAYCVPIPNSPLLIVAGDKGTIIQTLEDKGDSPLVAPPLVVSYRNYRGEISVRRIVPESVRFGTNEWHPEPGWLLLAFDCDKQSHREFALALFNPAVSIKESTDD